MKTLQRSTKAALSIMDRLPDGGSIGTEHLSGTTVQFGQMDIAECHPAIPECIFLKYTWDILQYRLFSTKQASVNLRRLKSYEVSFLTTTR
jgi:hypothetical protein